MMKKMVIMMMIWSSRFSHNLHIYLLSLSPEVGPMDGFSTHIQLISNTIIHNSSMAQTSTERFVRFHISMKKASFSRWYQVSRMNMIWGCMLTTSRNENIQYPTNIPTKWAKNPLKSTNHPWSNIIQKPSTETSKKMSLIPYNSKYIGFSH